MNLGQITNLLFVHGGRIRIRHWWAGFAVTSYLVAGLYLLLMWHVDASENNAAPMPGPFTSVALLFVAFLVSAARTCGESLRSGL